MRQQNRIWPAGVQTLAVCLLSLASVASTPPHAVTRESSKVPSTTSPASPLPALPDTCYLLSYFTRNGEDGLRLAWSTDGLRFTPLRGGRSFLRPEVGKERIMRDPCITRGPDGTFHMVWTDSWAGRTIGYANSKDLIHWSPQQEIPVMEGELSEARNCWAPEITWDPTARCFVIYWASTVPGRFPETVASFDDRYNHRIYSTTTTDFQTFTPTRLFYNGGFNVIDATIFIDAAVPGKPGFHLFVKDETHRPVAQTNLRVAHGQQLQGPYGEASPPFTGSWVEGPSAVRIGEHVVVYYDKYKSGRYGAARSKDLVKWEDLSDRVSFPPGARHGTVFPVPAETLRALLAEPAGAEAPRAKPLTTQPAPAP